MIGLRAYGLPSKAEALLFDKVMVAPPITGASPAIEALTEYLKQSGIVQEYPEESVQIGFDDWINTKRLLRAFFRTAWEENEARRRDFPTLENWLQEEVFPKLEAGHLDNNGVSFIDAITTNLYTFLPIKEYPSVTALPLYNGDLNTLFNDPRHVRHLLRRYELWRHNLDQPNLREQIVYQATFSRLPIPSELTPWEQVLEFRSDRKVREHFVALRRWIDKTVPSDLSLKEVQGELDYLLNSYENYMRIHRIEFRWELLRVILSAPAAAIKCDWVKLASLPSDIAKCRINLLKAELNAPGREIAYLVRAREEFES